MDGATPRTPPWTGLLISILIGALTVLWVTARRRRLRAHEGRFRVVQRTTIRPRGRVAADSTYELSILDKLWCPLNNISMVYFFEEDLDADVLCVALSQLLAEYPFLGGCIRGFHVFSRVDVRQTGVEVTEAETTYSLRDINFQSGALERQSACRPCGFGAAQPWDVWVQWFASAPVLRITITRLAGGGTALGVAASHTIMDAKSVMKVVELWSKKARTLIEQGGLDSLEDSGSEGEGEPLSPPQAWEGVSGAGHRVEHKEAFTPTSVLEDVAVEGYGQVPAWTVWSYLVYVYNAAFAIGNFILTLLRGNLESKTFFFSDTFLAELKEQVMEEIKQDQAKATGNEGTKLPSFVSTNDVLSAFVWKSIQGLQSRRNVRRRDGSRRVSKLHMVVDIRDSVIRPRALKEHRDRFYFGNAVIATSALHADPSCASLTELSRVIRASIQDLTPQAAMTQLGHYKRKEDFPKLLSIASGSNGSEWDLSTDVIFSCFSPLSSCNDFGTGPAFRYHLDLVPGLSMYTHNHKGCDRDGDNRGGLYVQLTAPPTVIRELVAEQLHFLPAAPTPEDYTSFTHRKTASKDYEVWASEQTQWRAEDPTPSFPSTTDTPTPAPIAT